MINIVQKLRVLGCLDFLSEEELKRHYRPKINIIKGE